MDKTKLNKEELKDLRKQLKELKDKIYSAIQADKTTEDVAMWCLQSQLLSHLIEASSLIHVFWRLAPTDSDPNKI